MLSAFALFGRGVFRISAYSITLYKYSSITGTSRRLSHTDPEKGLGKLFPGQNVVFHVEKTGAHFLFFLITTKLTHSSPSSHILLAITSPSHPYFLRLPLPPPIVAAIPSLSPSPFPPSPPPSSLPSSPPFYSA